MAVESKSREPKPRSKAAAISFAARQLLASDGVKTSESDSDQSSFPRLTEHEARELRAIFAEPDLQE